MSRLSGAFQQQAIGEPQTWIFLKISKRRANNFSILDTQVLVFQQHADCCRNVLWSSVVHRRKDAGHFCQRKMGNPGAFFNEGFRSRCLCDVVTRDETYEQVVSTARMAFADIAPDSRLQFLQRSPLRGTLFKYGIVDFFR